MARFSEGYFERCLMVHLDGSGRALGHVPGTIGAVDGVGELEV